MEKARQIRYSGAHSGWLIEMKEIIKITMQTLNEVLYDTCVLIRITRIILR